MYFICFLFTDCFDSGQIRGGLILTILVMLFSRCSKYCLSKDGWMLGTYSSKLSARYVEQNQIDGLKSIARTSKTEVLQDSI